MQKICAPPRYFAAAPRRRARIMHSPMQQITTPEWDEDALPTLMKYMQIPGLSPAFDTNCNGSGQLERAAELLAQWSRAALGVIDDSEVEIVRLPGRTPVLFIEVPGELNASVVLYGHLDAAGDGRLARWAVGLDADAGRGPALRPRRRGRWLCVVLRSAGDQGRA